MTDTQDLRKLAEAASPGPWAYGTFHRLLVVPLWEGVPDKHNAIADFGQGAIPWTDDKQAYNNAAYIAAANPAVIIAMLDTLVAAQAEIERLKESEQAYCELAHDAKPFVEANIKMRERLAELAEQKPLAWCQLSIGGSSIAYFDGKPIVMVGPVGNNCHTTPLFAAAGASPVQPSQAGELTTQDIYDIAHRKATRYTYTAAPSEVMYGFSEMHLLDFVAAINAKGVK